jgi:hypothetical protein
VEFGKAFNHLLATHAICTKSVSLTSKAIEKLNFHDKKYPEIVELESFKSINVMQQAGSHGE